MIEDLLRGVPDFMPRSHCGPGWTGFLVFWNKVFEFSIFLSYISITLSILIFFRAPRKKWQLPFKVVYVLFMLFIFGCGLTHLMGFTMFYRPAYRLDTALLGATSVFSVMTAVYLWFTAPKAAKELRMIQLSGTSKVLIWKYIEQEYKRLLEEEYKNGSS